MFATHFDVRIGQISALPNSLLCFVKITAPHQMEKPDYISPLVVRSRIITKFAVKEAINPAQKRDCHAGATHSFTDEKAPERLSFRGHYYLNLLVMTLVS